ncbi:hypothetical protein [Sphaerisporangium aureirubrum]|uniref:DUF4381 domain-containing protein n=1 Tax=Sphaerisporangium aureirubrum TaxID=1544736 RepID=A0ABW1ND86_9ACTN
MSPEELGQVWHYLQTHPADTGIILLLLLIPVLIIAALAAYAWSTARRRRRTDRLYVGNIPWHPESLVRDLGPAEEAAFEALVAQLPKLDRRWVR